MKHAVPIESRHERLCVVMPVYNEEAAIRAVLEKWTRALDRMGIDYTIRPYNDGSRDASLRVMQEVAASRKNIDVRDKANGGHGHTVLTGYRDATADGFDWVFQIDSDDEMGPECFPELWAQRSSFDFLVGRRAGRRQALPRKIVSFVSRLTVRLFYGKSAIWDVNAPYRLMRVQALKDAFTAIPEKTFAPNVIITGMAARQKLRSFEMPVPQHDRTTGEVSIRKWKLLKAAARSLWQTVAFAYSGRQSRLLWPFIAFVCSMASSSVAGRSLWIDEIMRVICQRKYTVDQLLSCKHLSDFDSQSPIGYILWRPIQSLLGMEFGGAILSALAAAVLVWAVLALARKLKGAELSPWICAVVALHPLIVYYGGELWFYMPWGAAFAMACLSILKLDESSGSNRVKCCLGIILWGYLFVALHFAGIFTWFVASAVFCLVCWFRRGFVSAFYTGVLMAIPALLNLSLYLRAQFAAKHLDSAGVNLGRLGELPDFLLNFFITLFPTLTGAWWFGSVVLIVGVAVLWRRRKRAELVFLLCTALSFVVYVSYAFLRGYAFVVSRFWLYALLPIMTLVVIGLDFLARRYRWGALITVLFLVSNFIGTAGVVSMKGRSEQTKWLMGLIEKNADADSLIIANHYNARQFNVWYKFQRERQLVYPAYWEQGEAARKGGLRQIFQLSPLSPVYIGDRGEYAFIHDAGCLSTNIVLETKSPLEKLAEGLCISFATSRPTKDSAFKGILFPLESELVAEAEKTGKPVFAPGREWTLRQMPPKDQKLPFTPFLMLGAKQQGVLRVYIPKNFVADRFVLSGMVGSSKSGSATFGGKTVGYGTAMARVVVPVESVRKGEWNEIPVKAGESFTAFMMPAVN